MAIWTSRYSNKELVENKDKYYCVGISLGTPKFPLGYTVEQQCYSLAPKGYMLRMELEKFTEEYYRKLEGIGNDKIIDMVMRFEKTAADEGKDLVLLCYEDVRIPEDWCHRTVFAQWYCEMTGEIIEELPDPNPPKVKKPPVQKQAKKEESKRTAAQKEANPDADSWVADFIKWWITPETGYPIPERSGVIRYMVRLNDEIIWGDSKEELAAQGYDAQDVKSVTFIASTLQDNQILMKMDPGYLANLKALPTVERERLLLGNWKIKAAAGLFFRRTQVGEMLEELPKDVISWCRGWDLAATSEDEDGDPAYTAGVLIGKRKSGRYIVADVINKRLAASDVRTIIKMTAQADKAKYKRVIERLPQDPGQAGKEQAQSYVKFLAGFLVKTIGESGSKESRAEPFAAQWQAGNVDVLIGEWNEMYFNQLESFPESKFKDMVDASSSAFNEVESGATFSAPPKDTLSKSSYWRG